MNGYPKCTGFVIFRIDNSQPRYLSVFAGVGVRKLKSNVSVRCFFGQQLQALFIAVHEDQFAIADVPTQFIND